jgi:hypothetical protein
MYYKIYATEQEAKQVSKQEGINRGCTGITKYWWSWQVHPETGECALKSSEEVESWTDTLDESWYTKEEQ